MLSGRHPFQAASFLATCDRIRKENPSPIRSLNPNVPLGLQEVVNRMLAKAPDKRYSRRSRAVAGFALRAADEHHIRNWFSAQLGARTAMEEDAGSRSGECSGGRSIAGSVCLDACAKVVAR